MTRRTLNHHRPLSPPHSRHFTPETPNSHAQVSPSTQPSPISFPPSSDQYAPHSPTQLVPIKGFVDEVLRQSPTSGSGLQTTLCYLEAIRSKVPELVQKEKNGSGVHGELYLSGRVKPTAQSFLRATSSLTSHPHSTTRPMKARPGM